MKFGYSLYPAGEYYVGDLCYIFGKKLWKEVCDACPRASAMPIAGERDKFFDKSNSSGYMSLSNGCILTCLNSGGDAEFQDQHHRKYGVDSGTLGIILKASIDNMKKSEMNSTGKYSYKQLGQIITFHHPFKVYMDSRNRLHFGDVIIRTWISK